MFKVIQGHGHSRSWSPKVSVIEDQGNPRSKSSMRLSGLKVQRYDYNHVDSPKCDFCGTHKEDAMHFLLQCNVFDTMRTVLLNNVKVLYQAKNLNLDLRRTIVKKELVKYMLCGDTRLNEQENTKLFEMVQQFISTSKRF